MLYIEVTENEFIDAFKNSGRCDQFSYLALRVLFDLYSELAEGMPGGIELDPIGICCDWGEYTMQELIESFGYLVGMDDVDEGEDYEDVLVEYLSDNGQLLIVEHAGDSSTYLFSE
jgi:hypothetical protein